MKTSIKVWNTGDKEFPTITKYRVLGKTFYEVKNKDGEKFIRVSPLAVKELTGAKEGIIKILEGNL